MAFDAVTSGNFAGVNLAFHGGDDASVSVETNLTNGQVGLQELGLEDHVLDAGGLERQIRIRRLPDELGERELTAEVAVELWPG